MVRSFSITSIEMGGRKAPPCTIFAPDENVTAKRADLQGIVDRAAARAGHHRVGGAVTILLRELAQVRYEFQVAVP